MPFTKLTPLEYASLADRERVHTAWLAWLLGEHSPWPPSVRGQFAAKLCDRPTPLDVEATRTFQEWSGNDERKPSPRERRKPGKSPRRRLDLLVRVDERGGAWYLAVEAKLKASEHSEQLAAYDRALAPLERPVSKVLLSLDGTAPRTGKSWQSVSFKRLADLLGEAIDASGSPNAYATDYQAMVARLALAVALTERDSVAQCIFASPREAQVDLEQVPGFPAYISVLKLRRILQQAWMYRLGRRVHEFGSQALPAGWSFDVGESNGAALLNIHLPNAYPEFTAGLQVQHQALKMFCQPYPYPSRATAEQTKGASEHLRRMMAAASIDERINPARSRGFTSVTLGNGPRARNLEEWAVAVQRALRTTVRAVSRAQG
ncbi:MAG: PD-(D/E)XK nuclease family protein [Anaeromyxobacter sp.]|nr:PD-(D/E)XK nuclease family protein [Anaeromyxobacter sp.]